MDELSIDLGHSGRVRGACEPRFARVRDAFVENFRTRGEVGAAVCIYESGRKRVDLWGGIADPGTGAPWEADTLVCTMSVGKALTGLCVLRLVDQGRVELERPVADYWPRFGQAGKAGITVEQLLGGLAALVYADSAPEDGLMDWNAMVDALERQPPNWEPGTRGAYHSMSAGFLFGELVRQVDGRDIATFFREELAAPLDLDFAYGLDHEQLRRVAPILLNEDSVTLKALGDPTSNLARAWRAMPKAPGFFNSRAFRVGVYPSANGHGNARAIAKLYAALSAGGSLNGVRVIGPELVERLRTPLWFGPCALTGREFSYGLAFFINEPQPRIMGPNARAFGHPGMGGAFGWADPEHRLAFGYSPNKMCDGASIGERCRALVEAVFQ